MKLGTRDQYVITILKSLSLTGRQQVLETCRIIDKFYIKFSEQTDADVETDVTGLQTAISALNNPAVRATAVTGLVTAKASGLLPDYPLTPGGLNGNPVTYCQNGVDTTAAVYNIRAVNGGA